MAASEVRELPGSNLGYEQESQSGTGKIIASESQDGGANHVGDDAYANCRDKGRRPGGEDASRGKNPRDIGTKAEPCRMGQRDEARLSHQQTHAHGKNGIDGHEIHDADEVVAFDNQRQKDDYYRKASN